MCPQKVWLHRGQTHHLSGVSLCCCPVPSSVGAGPPFCAGGPRDTDGWHLAPIPFQQCVSANTKRILQPGSTRVGSPSEGLANGCVLAQAPWQALAALRGGGLPALLSLSVCLSLSLGNLIQDVFCSCVNPSYFVF